MPSVHDHEVQSSAQEQRPDAPGVVSVSDLPSGEIGFDEGGSARLHHVRRLALDGRVESCAMA